MRVHSRLCNEQSDDLAGWAGLHSKQQENRAKQATTGMNGTRETASDTCWDIRCSARR